ncbi:hypothetical protein GOP47_0012915 [Adiantum capillus-veneris]|uniref:Pentatricopeptide repeat-containing protein n=1 Tax=Adiantum capillus-veneris TaxID=13818 RepID=A0A9D4US10_ADICA|nr:hypothetical protein GOP47_0012915 [Adiantum capillus-veneris]
MERSQERALRLQKYMQRNGLISCPSLGNRLVSIMVEVGCIHQAQSVFDGLLCHDERGWNSLILGYCKHEEPHHALQLFQKMQESHEPPILTGYTIVALLQACAVVKDLRTASALHAEIMRKELLEKDVYISGALIDTYAKCGSLAKAQELFDKLFARDVVSWTSFIAGYVEHGYAHKALYFFEQMQQQGIAPDCVTFVCALKACGMLGNTNYGRQLAQKLFSMLPFRNLVFWNALIAGYAEQGLGEEALKCHAAMKQEGIFPNGVTYVCLLKACRSMESMDNGHKVYTEIAIVGLDVDLSVGSTLVDMYTRWGSLQEAQAVFDELPVKGVVTWNALIAGYAETCGERTLDCFRDMELGHACPDAVTFVSCLKACGSIGDLDMGLHIHVKLARKGLDTDLVVGSALIHMYGKFGLLAKAREVFDRLPVRDAVSWNALITGYIENGHSEEALVCFDQLHLHGIYPHPIMLGCILKACASIGYVPKGHKIHAEIARRGLEADLGLGCTLLDFYAKCGFLATAQKVFDKLATRDVVCWNALIGGYTSFGFHAKALEYFDRMQTKGVCPDDSTYACVLKACSKSGVTFQNQELHAEITMKGLEKELFIGSTLVNIYARCGFPIEAQNAFSMLPVQDVVTWTALVSGYALQLGEILNTMQVFEKMIGAGIEPNTITLMSVLNALSHSGQVDKGQMYFKSISSPAHDHYSCMLDVFGRAGYMEEAVAVIENMPFHPGNVVWDTMLGACRKWQNVELGRQAFKHAVMVDESNTAAYVCMSNIYADAAYQDSLKVTRHPQLKSSMVKIMH